MKRETMPAWPLERLQTFDTPAVSRFGAQPLGADLVDHATVVLTSTMWGQDFPVLRLIFWRQGACVQLMPEPHLFVPGAMCDARLFALQIAEFSAERPAMIVPGARPSWTRTCSGSHPKGPHCVTRRSET